MRRITWLPLALTLAAVAACATDLPYPGSATDSLSPSKASASWGPETPPFNLEVILRGESGGFGLVKFRQPNDGQAIIYLDTWVRDLAPNTSYAFAVGDNTWHSADPVGGEVDTRDSILLTYFVDAGMLRFFRNRGKRIGNFFLNEFRSWTR